MPFHIRQLVKYRHPTAGEADLTFEVVEDNGDRVLIQSRDFADWRVPPRETVPASELIAIDGPCPNCGMPHTEEHACEPIWWGSEKPAP